MIFWLFKIIAALTTIQSANACHPSIGTLKDEVVNVTEKVFRTYYALVKERYEAEQFLLIGNKEVLFGKVEVKAAVFAERSPALAINTYQKHIENVIELCSNNRNIALEKLSGLRPKFTDISQITSIAKDTDIEESLKVKSLDAELSEFALLASEVEAWYDTFLTIYRNPSKINPKTEEAFIKFCLFGTLKSNMDNIANKLTQRSRILHTITYEAETYVMAAHRVSTLELMNNLLFYYAGCEIRAYLMIYAADSMSRASGETNPLEIQDYKRAMFTRAELVIWKYKDFSKRSTGRYWIHDTNKYVIGTNYVRFTNFMRGYYYRNTFCSNVEPTVKDIKDMKGSPENLEYCVDPKDYKCLGRNYCDKDPHKTVEVHVCYSDPSRGRLFDYVLYNKKPKQTCRGSKKEFPIVNQRCTDCKCYCDEPNGDTHRHISLDEMVSDQMQNEIITGLRFNQNNGAITIDIQITKLGLDGTPMKQTSKWIINEAITQFKLSYPTKRTIHLTTVSTDDRRSFVTGIRFDETSDGVELQVRFGDVIKCSEKHTLSISSQWIKASRQQETNIDLHNTLLDDPSKAILKPMDIDTFDNQRILVTPTSFEKDGAQTPVPFFDTRPVAPIDPVMLRGIGLIYRSTPNFGGFISPYIIIKPVSNEFSNYSIYSLIERSQSTSLFSFAIGILHFVIGSVVLLIF